MGRYVPPNQHAISRLPSFADEKLKASVYTPVILYIVDLPYLLLTTTVPDSKHTVDTLQPPGFDIPLKIGARLRKFAPYSSNRVSRDKDQSSVSISLPFLLPIQYQKITINKSLASS